MLDGRARDRSGVQKKGIGGAGTSQGNGGKADPDLSRVAGIVADQGVAATDQSASDADQTASDADQSLSDTERDLAARDQGASDQDQRASDRDQAVSDKELSEHPGPEAKAVHDANLAERQAGSDDRVEAGQTRSSAAEERSQTAERRDETAWHRDVTAQARDGAADRRDRDSAKIERKMASRGTSLRTALVHVAEVRAQAARDRARAAEDRAQAAADRQRAADERAATLEELRRAHRDELTGAFLRGAGEEALQGEIDRARRGDARLVLAFFDVDGLREINNSEGHLAGDALLRDVVSAIRSKIRTYEPIVRFGGDEFVCVVAEVDLKQAEKRFAAVKDLLAASNGGPAVSVGLAELREDDKLADLIERADIAMLEARRSGPREAD
jgi:diguanylate cyclase (GGDEF)-like protein